MTQPKLTPEQYRQTRGTRCPQCGAEDIVGEEVTIDAGGASQACSCNACNSTWTDTYILTGYDDLEFIGTDDGDG